VKALLTTLALFILLAFLSPLYPFLKSNGGIAEHTVTVPQRATLVQQEQCSQDAERYVGKLISAPFTRTTSHYDAVSGRCLGLLDLRIGHSDNIFDRQLYDVNEGVHLAGLRGREGDAYTMECWVADLTGFHRGCNSLESYDALVKKYYGVTQ
jgi:hypothetical protein